MLFLPKQKTFLASTLNTKVFLGGSGSGKTMIGLVEDVKLSFINQGCAGMIVSPTYRMSRDIVQRDLIKYLNGKTKLNPFPIRFVPVKGDEKIIFPQWNSELWFRSGDDPEKLRGPNLAFVHYDEVGDLSYDSYTAADERIRDPNAKILQKHITSTPGDEVWLEKEFPYDNEDDIVFDQKRGVLFLRAKTQENIALGQRYVQDKIDRYDKKRQERFLEGKYISLTSDPVYSMFTKERNVIDSYTPNYDYPVFISCDFNINPCVWILIQRIGKISYFFDEIIMYEATTDKMCNALAEKILDGENSPKYPKTIFYGDSTSMDQRGTTTSFSDWDIIAKRFHNIFGYEDRVYRNPWLKERAVVVNKMLELGYLKFPKSAEYLIRDMQKTKYADNGKFEKSKKDRNMTHGSDDVDYYVYDQYNIDDDVPYNE